MPHFIVEYSANIADDIDVHGLFATVHQAALATGVFPLGGIRFRAVRCDDYLIADGDADNAFVHMILKVGHGRSEAVLMSAGEQVFAALTAHLDAVYASRPLAISFEMAELHPLLNFKKNNIHDKLME